MAVRKAKHKSRRNRRQKARFPDPVLVSIPEFARLSGLGGSLTRLLAIEGVLPTCMIGNRRWIIREEAIERLKQLDVRKVA
jgi:hypothetical protein